MHSPSTSSLLKVEPEVQLSIIASLISSIVYRRLPLVYGGWCFTEITSITVVLSMSRCELGGDGLKMDGGEAGKLGGCGNGYLYSKRARLPKKAPEPPP